MSGINQNIIFSVCRLKAIFCDDIGNSKCIMGTGFWLRTETNKDIFITNRHNLDPSLKLGENTTFRIHEVKIELRQDNEGRPTLETNFFKVKDEVNSIILHEGADVAIIVSPEFEDIDINYIFYPLVRQKNLADNNFFENSLSLMDTGSFIGFPGQGASQWWDQHSNLGIARMFNIASYPPIPFSHPDIITESTMLVSGLSFSGSSGSLVMSHSKGLNLGEGIEGGEGYVPPTMIGIMSGHWQEQQVDIPQMFQHSGLSYFTRSTAILELIATI